jgi:hypothetical protein
VKEIRHNIIPAIIIGLAIVIAAYIIGNAIDQAGMNIANQLRGIWENLR